MAFSKKKPLPTRRSRAAKEVDSAADSASEAGEAAADAQVSASEASEAAAEAQSTAGGLEMALIVVTFVALIAAFALLEFEMNRAFGATWPI